MRWHEASLDERDEIVGDILCNLPEGTKEAEYEGKNITNQWK